MSNIIEEKKRLLELAIKFGDFTKMNPINTLHLERIWWGGLEDEKNDMYISGMHFIKTDNGWISEMGIDEPNEEGLWNTTHSVPLVTNPTNSLEDLLINSVKASHNFWTDWRWDMFLSPEKYAEWEKRVDLKKLPAGLKIQRESYDNKIREVLATS